MHLVHQEYIPNLGQKRVTLSICRLVKKHIKKNAATVWGIKKNTCTNHAVFWNTCVFTLIKSHFLCHLDFIFSFLSLLSCLVYLSPSILVSYTEHCLLFTTCATDEGMWSNQTKIKLLLPGTKKYNEAKIGLHVWHTPKIFKRII